MNSTTVMNIRYGYDRFLRGDQGNPANFGFDLTELGFPASYANAIPADIRKFPRFDIAGYQGTGVAGEDRPIENQTFIATLNKVMGAHSFRTGVEYPAIPGDEHPVAADHDRAVQFRRRRGCAARSTIRRCRRAAASVAAFLLGLPENSSFVQRAPGYEESSSTTGIFLQDDWRVGSRLTLNLGVRYEFESPLVEAENRTARGFDASACRRLSRPPPARHTPRARQRTRLRSCRRHSSTCKAGSRSRASTASPRGSTTRRRTTSCRAWASRTSSTTRPSLRGGYGMYYGFLGQRRGDVIRRSDSARRRR